MIAIDQDREKEGLQLDCEIHEADLDVKLVPKLQAKKAPKADGSKDKDGKAVMEEVKGPDGKPVMEPVTEEVKGSDGKSVMVPVLDVAKQPDGTWLFVEREVSPIKKQCAPFEPFAKEEGDHDPCWAVSYQPNVCRDAFYYTTTCAPGAPCEKDWKVKRGNELAAKFSAPAYKQDDCELAQYTAAVDVANANKEAKKDGKPLSGLTIGPCVYSEAVGFIVDFGGHHEADDRFKDKFKSAYERMEKEEKDEKEHPKAKSPREPAEHEMRAVAVCKPPPPPKAKPDDLFAEEVHKTKLGEKSVSAGESHEELGEHEQLYMGPPPDHTNMFFTVYFAMTGLHGIHVFVGVIVFIWLLIRAIKGHFTPDYFGPVDFAALYWHIVDLIWIFLFPLLYLIH
jgi:cytochrome c oxidase subunit III